MSTKAGAPPVKHKGPPKAPPAEGMFSFFAMLWGAAAIFHVMGPSGRAFGVISLRLPLGISQALLCVAALWLIARPRRLGALICVAVLSFATLFLEAPQLGNHWLLVGFVDLSLLLAMVVARREGKVDWPVLERTFLPMARLCLIIFYCFAAFAKLNSAFFNTSVSCASFFFDETACSYGLATPIAVGAGGIAKLVPILSALTELSVPVLLIGRRTRMLGVLVGLTFHSIIALDRTHLFIDFSSVLAALFVLFMPEQFGRDAMSFLGSKRGRTVMRTWTGLALVVLIAQWVGRFALSATVFIQGRMLLWLFTDVALVAGTVLWIRRNYRSAEPLEKPLTVPAQGRWLLAIVPVIIVINGLFPYLELRTAFGYTMYSNLRMVDGTSNHFLIRSSFPVAHRQHDLVKVVSTSDLGLQHYVNADFAIPWDSFRSYLSRYPNLAVTYERAGKTYVVARAGANPTLVNPPPELVQKLMPLRAVDTRNPPRCQDVFLPAL